MMLAVLAAAALNAGSPSLSPNLASYPPGVVKLGLQAVWDLPATLPATRLAVPPDGDAALANGTLDLTGANAARHAPIYVGGQFSADHVNFQNAPRDFLITFAGSTTRIAWSAFGSFGQKTDFGDHLEPIQAYGGGLIVIDYTLFRSPLAAGGGLSAYGLQMQTDVASQVTLITRSIFANGRTIGSHTPSGLLVTGGPALSCKAVKYDQVQLVGNTAIEASPSGVYVVKTELNGHRCVVIDLGGNVDLTSAAPIVLR